MPAILIRAGQRVEVRADAEQVQISAAAVDGGGILTRHRRSRTRGSWVVDEVHWAGLPDGHTRAVTTDPGGLGDLAAARARRRTGREPALPGHVAAAMAVPVAVRPLRDYAAGTGAGR